MKTFNQNHIILLIVLGFVTGSITAQKYKDIQPVIVLATDDEAMPILKQYLASDPEHPNANMLLALIYDRRYKAADVLTEYEKALANAERAKPRITKSLVLVSERDVRKNTGYYSTFSVGTDSKGRVIVDYETVRSALQRKYDSVALFLEKAPPIYSTFVKAVNSYDAASKIFYKINSKYNSLDDLYLLYDDELKADLEKLKVSYDSTVAYLDSYKQKIAEYPINNHRQDYAINDIETYRLSGLMTQSDFLRDDIQLWNYGKWADEVNTLVSSDIIKLRTGITAYEKTLDQSIVEAKNPNNFSSYKPQSINKELLFTLKKYDNNSLLASLFQYKNFLQTVAHRKNNMNYYDTAVDVPSQSKYAYFGEMINAYHNLDSLLGVSKTRLNENNVAKHASFMEEYYKGYKGVDAYINFEKKNNSADFGKYVFSLRNAIISDLTSDTLTNSGVISYGRRKIPLNKRVKYHIDSLQHGALVTTHVEENADDSKYIAGVYKSAKGINNSIAYLVRVSPQNRVQWYKEYDIEIDSAGSDANNIVAGMKPTQAGCVFVIRSEHKTNGTAKNTLVYLDEQGNPLMLKQIDIADYPRKINYNEKTNSFIIAFRDNQAVQNITSERKTSLLNINVLGDVIWSYEYSFSGTLEDVVNTNNGYLVVGNYSSKKDNNGSIIRTKVTANETGIYLDFISSKGNLKNTQIIRSVKPTYFGNITKVNDSNISVLGMKGAYNPTLIDFSNTSDITYIFTNAKLQVIYSNL